MPPNRSWLRPDLALTRLVTGTIRIYSYLISPLFPSSCRFYPSCSIYTLEAIEKRGIWRGIAMAIWRLLRCHPWHPGGYDPVTDNDRITDNTDTAHT